jgi:hypothetical protein
MKSKIGIIVSAVVLCFSAVSFGQEFNDQFNSSQYQSAQRQGRNHGKKRVRRAFRLGVCVGQTLAQAGVILPAPHSGQKWTDQEKAALKAARTACVAAFRSKPTGGTGGGSIGGSGSGTGTTN